MKKLLTGLLCTILFSTSQVHAAEPEMSAEDKKYIEWANKLWKSMHPKTGEIKLSNGVATLNVPEDFYYLSPEDSEKVLVEVWGNMPGAGTQTLGMLMPAEYTPFDNASWGVTIEHEEDGYVSDEDADEINYDDMLAQMQEDTAAASEERVKQGYQSISLMGWASKPYYDKENHKLHWAKELKVGGNQQHTLNYNIRVLGRKGVLILNFIAGMNQLDMINNKRDAVLSMAEFDQGSRYEDFDPSMDQVAAYGIGALVAGKVIAKTGLIAAALIFLKKFGIIFLLGAAALFRKFFKRGKIDTES